MDGDLSPASRPSPVQAFGSAVRDGSLTVARRVAVMFTSKGPGFRHLAESHAGSVGGDTLVAMALAGSLFFSVPTTEARENVALYLLITLAPFAVLGPFLGSVFERFPGAYRSGLVMSSVLRAVVALIMSIGLDTFWLFPLAFVLLVLSRFHGISKSSVLPVVLDRPIELVAANAQLARVGVLASAVVAPLGGLAIWAIGSWPALVLAAAVYVYAAFAGLQLPPLVDETSAARRPVRIPKARRVPPRPVRLARFATAGVRFLNGYLLLHVAFAFRDQDAGVADFGTLLAAGGIGFFIAAFVTPVLDRYMSEEPMVVAALAVEAGAAFIAAQTFGLPAAATLAAAAGFAWGTAKFGFDGLLQATMPATTRGRAFTNSETLFQAAWVVGALIPVVPVIPVKLGLTLAGIAALTIQVIYVSAVIVPAAHRHRLTVESQPPRPDVLDLL